MQQTMRLAAERFSDFHEDAVKRLLAMGLTQSQIDSLREYGLLANDNVTGFHEGRSGPGRVATLRRAIRHASRTGTGCFYVEMDVRNLGGLNAVLGHTGANEVFSALAAIIRTELTSIASEAIFFRHGGDEMSAFLIDTTEQAVQVAFANIREAVAELARKRGLSDIIHPKHPHDQRCRGTGVCFAAVRLLSEHEHDPTVVFRIADADMVRNKCVGRTEVE
jgi:GGDEF domain-containing protein